MKKMLLGLAVSSFAAVPAFASEQIHWGYEGEGAPEHWGELDPQFSACSQGKNQSPINLSSFIEAELPPIEIKYEGAKATEIFNNGHSVQINYAPGSSITVDGISFELKQFHFHTTSENLLDGKSFPLEAHLVHADKDGNLAVIGVMFEDGAANPLIADLWQRIPVAAGDKKALAGGDPLALLPENKDYYRFNGSLTTPPCTEGVRWLVMKQPLTVSKEQVEIFAHVMKHPNNRPVQGVNARPVLQ